MQLPIIYEDFDKGIKAKGERDWETAIISFLASLRHSPENLPSYTELMKTYLGAFEDYDDPELLDQVLNVAEGARRHMDLETEQKRQIEELARKAVVLLKELDDDVIS